MGGPLLAIPALIAAVGVVLTIGMVTMTVITSINVLIGILAAGSISQEELEQLGKLEESLDQYLKSIFDMPDTPLIPRSDIIVPSKDSNPFRIPVKIGGGLMGGGGKGGAGGAWMSFPGIIVHDPNGRVIIRRPPSGGYIPPPPPPWPPIDVPPFCGPPWKPWNNPEDPNGPGPMGSLPICAAAGHLYEAPGIVYNKGMAGGITIRDFTSQGVFHIRKFLRSAAVTVTNNTDEVLILGDPFTTSAVQVGECIARHGGALATSMYCFPGQSFQVGGVSAGAGVEVVFRLQAWSVPRETNVDQNLLAKIQAEDKSLEVFMLKSGPSTRVADICLFLDVPWAGGNKINVAELEAGGNWDQMAADYSKTQNNDYDIEGARYKAAFRIPKGENPVGQVTISKK